LQQEWLEHRLEASGVIGPAPQLLDPLDHRAPAPIAAREREAGPMEPCDTAEDGIHLPAVPPPGQPRRPVLSDHSSLLRLFDFRRPPPAARRDADRRNAPPIVPVES
jgi:hypothetical protein